jgi:hypothetical protein
MHSELRECFAKLDAAGRYDEIRSLQERLASVMRPVTAAASGIHFFPDSFSAERRSSPELAQRYVELAVRDLCADLQQRGLARLCTVRVVTADAARWEAVRDELAAASGAKIELLPSPAGGWPDDVLIVDSLRHADPQRAVSALWAEWPPQEPAAGELEAILSALRATSWGPAFIADLVETVMHRKGEWNLFAVNTLLQHLAAGS